MSRIRASARCVLTLAIATALAGSALSRDRPDPVRIAEQLGARDYRDREAAGKRLEELGAEALPALRAIVVSGSLDAALRAEALIARIEKRIDHSKVAAGTIVELEAKEQTAGEALASLRRQTGYALELVGDRTPLSKTLIPKGGKALFWDALDELAASAGLVVDRDTALKTTQRGTGIAALARPDSFVLRKRTTETRNPVCVSGAYRIEPIPGSSSLTRQMLPARSAVILQITPEPRCCWDGTLEVLLGNARDQSGRSLGLDRLEHNPFLYSDLFPEGDGRYRFYDDERTIRYSQYQASVKFQSHADGPSRRLKTFEGIVRGRIWGQPETLLTIAKLSGDFQEVTGADSLSLKAKLETLPGEPNALCLSVVLDYGMSVIPTGVWDGLILSDRAEKMMTLHTLNISTGNLSPKDRLSRFRMTARYALRPSKPGDKPDPQVLIFSGCLLKSIDILFQLKDVPLICGTGPLVIPKVEFLK